MEQTSVAEQRATAVAKLKRAASLPRMKDGRRPPMHVEAVSEGERMQGEDKPDEDSAHEPDEKPDAIQTDQEKVVDEERSLVTESKAEDIALSETPPNPTRKRRSRSRTRSRGSKDLRNRQKPTIITSTTESSADENYTSAGGEDAPPSPPLVSPIPSRFGLSPASRLLRSPVSPGSPLLYPGTTPSTPLPTLDQLQKGIGLYRSNSAGAARAMAMSKLTGGTEPVDMSFISPSTTPDPFLGRTGLTRNNTVAGGERIAARKFMMRRLGERVKEADGEQTSGGEDVASPSTPVAGKRRRRRSRRSSSRASTVLDDRDDRELPSTSPNTPVVPASPLPQLFGHAPDPPWAATMPQSHTQNSKGFEYEAPPMGGRGVVVEDEEEEDIDRLCPPKPYPGLPITPARIHGPRLPHTSDAPSSTSTDSAPASAIPVPFFISSKSGAYRQDAFPASPFATPLKEKAFPDGDEDEESDTFQELGSRAPTRNAFERDSEISWVAEPVPRMPVHDDDDEEDEEQEAGLEPTALEPDAPAAEAPERESSESLDTISPHASPTSKVLVVDLETSPETTPALEAPSPFPSATRSTPVPIEQSAISPSPSVYPMRLSVATPIQMDRSPSTTDFPDWEENRATGNDSTPKREGSHSTWARVKNTFTRSTSSNGRRSRTNSIGRRYNTDSSVSRESGASLASPKVDKGDDSGVFSQQQSQPPVMQSPSASASILSLAPQSGPPPGHSGIPPASSADLLKYADSKLFPFPGMKQLEEQRNRAKGISASTPDISLQANGHPNGIEAVPSSGSSSSATTRSPEHARERKISHQMSDSRLLAKYQALNSPHPPPISSAPSNTSQMDYFSIQSSTNSTRTATTGSMKLPTSVEGVRKWMKVFMPSSRPSTPSVRSPPTSEHRAHVAPKKPSLNDLFKNRKDMELSVDWEEISSSSPSSARTPTNASTISPLKTLFKEEQTATEVHADVIEHAAHDSNPDVPQSARSTPQIPFATNGSPSPAPFSVSDFSGFPSPPDPPSSATPDPQSSLDEFPTRSTSDSYSTVSSSQHSPDRPSSGPSKAAIIMERLDEVLGRGSKSSLWPTAIDDPSRKLVLSSPVLQVANANTVKDRFLFLFNDIIVIAKPVVQDQDALLDSTKPTPMDRKFIVKSVVLLRDLKFSSDRDDKEKDDPRSKTSSNTGPMRHPVIRSFVHQFAKEPDHAISILFDKSNCRDDPITLGQLLFRCIDINRVRLGEYLALRTSKLVLKAYVDGFGFQGLRIDKALRVFLLSICIPPKLSALDYLLDTFASRWYEANAGIVAWDKDLAVRLVRAIAQLNEVMHGGIAQSPGMTRYPKQNILSRDFVEAFRRFDGRGLIMDEHLEKIYASIRHEKLSQARNPSSQNGMPDVLITVKRPLPPRLTYRVQSEPVVLRLPQPDPQFSIQLFGQDLIFDPPVLSFAKSAEASFRITGTSLGPKSIIMLRSGPNALAYTGLPQSSPLVVERAFMRNTFQLAFMNHAGVKRKYMFSVNDAVLRHQWATSIKQHIELASSLAAASTVAPGQTSKSCRAAEALSFKVLQDTLINPVDIEDTRELYSAAAVDHALARLTGASLSPSLYNGLHNVNGVQRRSRLDGISSHSRSKSRSQIYHRHGAGKLEHDLNDDPEPSSDDSQNRELFPSQRLDDRLWSGHELQVICRQNSSIASVLAYLQGDQETPTAGPS